MIEQTIYQTGTAAHLKVCEFGDQAILDQLKVAFSNMPVKVRTLNLSDNNLGLMGLHAYLDAYVNAALDPLFSMGLFVDPLKRMGEEPLANILAIIPAKVEVLHLSNNQLGGMGGVRLAKVLAAIRSNVTTLHLSNNKLASMGGAQLAKALAAIPSNVTTLYLSCNELEIMGGAQLAKALAAIRSNVTTLHLSNNKLASMDVAPLAKLAAITDNGMKKKIMYSVEDKNIVCVIDACDLMYEVNKRAKSGTIVFDDIILDDKYKNNRDDFKLLLAILRDIAATEEHSIARLTIALLLCVNASGYGIKSFKENDYCSSELNEIYTEVYEHMLIVFKDDNLKLMVAKIIAIMRLDVKELIADLKLQLNAEISTGLGPMPKNCSNINELESLYGVVCKLYQATVPVTPGWEWKLISNATNSNLMTPRFEKLQKVNNNKEFHLETINEFKRSKLFGCFI